MAGLESRLNGLILGGDSEIGKACISGLNSFFPCYLNVTSRRPKNGFHDGLNVLGFYRKAGISDKNHYHWHKKLGGMGCSQLSKMRVLCKENKRLKRILIELQLDKSSMKESLNYDNW